MTKDSLAAWIWADSESGGVKGARYDAAADLIEWIDQPGCACGNAIQRQSIADFLSQGPRETPPDDVLGEMRRAICIDSQRQRR